MSQSTIDGCLRTRVRRIGRLLEEGEVPPAIPPVDLSGGLSFLGKLATPFAAALRQAVRADPGVPLPPLYYFSLVRERVSMFTEKDRVLVVGSEEILLCAKDSTIISGMELGDLGDLSVSGKSLRIQHMSDPAQGFSLKPPDLPLLTAVLTTLFKRATGLPISFASGKTSPFSNGKPGAQQKARSGSRMIRFSPVSQASPPPHAEGAVQQGHLPGSGGKKRVRFSSRVEFSVFVKEDFESALSETSTLEAEDFPTTDDFPSDDDDFTDSTDDGGRGGYPSTVLSPGASTPKPQQRGQPVYFGGPPSSADKEAPLSSPHGTEEDEDCGGRDSDGSPVSQGGGGVWSISSGAGVSQPAVSPVSSATPQPPPPGSRAAAGEPHLSNEWQAPSPAYASAVSVVSITSQGDAAISVSPTRSERVSPTQCQGERLGVRSSCGSAASSTGGGAAMEWGGGGVTRVSSSTSSSSSSSSSAETHRTSSVSHHVTSSPHPGQNTWGPPTAPAFYSLPEFQSTPSDASLYVSDDDSPSYYGGFEEAVPEWLPPSPSKTPLPRRFWVTQLLNEGTPGLWGLERLHVEDDFEFGEEDFESLSSEGWGAGGGTGASGGDEEEGMCGVVQVNSSPAVQSVDVVAIRALSHSGEHPPYYAPASSTSSIGSLCNASLPPPPSNRLASLCQAVSDVQGLLASTESRCAATPVLSPTPPFLLTPPQDSLPRSASASAPPNPHPWAGGSISGSGSSGAPPTYSLEKFGGGAAGGSAASALGGTPPPPPPLTGGGGGGGGGGSSSSFLEGFGGLPFTKVHSAGLHHGLPAARVSSRASSTAPSSEVSSTLPTPTVPHFELVEGSAVHHPLLGSPKTSAVSIGSGSDEAAKGGGGGGGGGGGTPIASPLPQPADASTPLRGGEQRQQQPHPRHAHPHHSDPMHPSPPWGVRHGGASGGGGSGVSSPTAPEPLTAPLPPLLRGGVVGTPSPASHFSRNPAPTTASPQVGSVGGGAGGGGGGGSSCYVASPLGACTVSSLRSPISPLPTVGGRLPPAASPAAEGRAVPFPRESVPDGSAADLRNLLGGWCGGAGGGGGGGVGGGASPLTATPVVAHTPQYAQGAAIL